MRKDNIHFSASPTDKSCSSVKVEKRKNSKDRPSLIQSRVPPLSLFFTSQLLEIKTEIPAFLKIARYYHERPFPKSSRHLPVYSTPLVMPTTRLLTVRRMIAWKPRAILMQITFPLIPLLSRSFLVRYVLRVVTSLVSCALLRISSFASLPATRSCTAPYDFGARAYFITMNLIHTQPTFLLFLSFFLSFPRFYSWPHDTCVTPLFLRSFLFASVMMSLCKKF